MPAPLLLSAAAALVAVPVLAVTVLLGSGAADPPPAGTVCTVTATSMTPADHVPVGAAMSLSGEQAGNARVIVAAAKALGLPQQAAAVAIMTGRQESALLVLANPAVPGSGDYPHQGSGSDHDSVGCSSNAPARAGAVSGS